MEKWKVKDCNKRGRIDRLEYTSLSPDNETIVKYANVYLPHDYTQRKNYNVLYLIHGGGGNPDAWFDHAPTKNILDNMIANGEIEPLIVVTPSFYSAEQEGFNPEWLKEQTELFQRELAEDLIPAVESKYSTHAEHLDPKEARKHRAISGFSMGGVVTWFALTHNLNNFSYFAPLSGDCWEVEVKGGATKPEETSKCLADHIKASENTDDYFIYAVTGTEDIAYPQLSVQCEAMSKLTDVFGEKNFKYHFEEGYVHSYEDVCNYLRLVLPTLFK